MFMMVIAHAHERCFQLQEELDFRLYEAVLLFAGTQQWRLEFVDCRAVVDFMMIINMARYLLLKSSFRLNIEYAVVCTDAFSSLNM